MSNKLSKIEVLKTDVQETGVALKKLSEKHKQSPGDDQVTAELREKQEHAQEGLEVLRETNGVIDATKNRLAKLKLEVNKKAIDN